MKRMVMVAAGCGGVALFMLAVLYSRDMARPASDEAVAHAAAAVCGFRSMTAPQSSADAENGMQKVTVQLRDKRETCATLFQKFGPLGTVRPGMLGL